MCGFKNASVCTFKTSPCMPAPRAHVFQHVRVVYVLNRHTEAFLNPHTGGRRQFCLRSKAHVEVLLGHREVHQRNSWLDQTHFQFENRSRTTCPDSSNHSLYLIKLFNSSYTEGHCGGNQQPDGSICLSPLSLPPSSSPPSTNFLRIQLLR